jgi:predicted peptidase
MPPGHPILRLTVVAPQLPDRDTPWTDVVDDVGKILAHYRTAGKKLYIMGFSKGGLGAFQVAAQLHADALVAIDASPMSLYTQKAFSRWVQPLREFPFWAIHTSYPMDRR